MRDGDSDHDLPQREPGALCRGVPEYLNTFDPNNQATGYLSGRIYTIKITCTDAAGNSSMQTVTVSVPQSKGR